MGPALEPSASSEAFAGSHEARSADAFPEQFDARRRHAAPRAIAAGSDSEAPRDVRRRERIYRRSLAGADALAAAIAVLVAIDVVGGFLPCPLYLLLAPLIVLAAKAGGLYVGRSIATGLARRISPVERCLLVGRRDAFERLDHKFGGGLTTVAGRFRAFRILLEGDTRATVEPQRWRVFAGGCRATRYRRNR